MPRNVINLRSPRNKSQDNLGEGPGRYRVSLPIQLASAATAGVDLFITNDDRLSRKHVPDVKFITSLERAYL